MSCNHHWVLERYKGTYCLKCDISAVDVINDLRANLGATYRAIESLTPGGSEFHEDPQRCVDHIKQFQDGLYRKMVKETAARKEAERHKQLFCDEMNVYKKGCAVVERQRDELQAELAATEEEISRVIEIDNATRKARVEEMEEFLNKYDIEYDCGWRSKIDDLISGLKEEIDHLGIAADSKVDVSRHMEVLKERDEYKAHTALLVGALLKAKSGYDKQNMLLIKKHKALCDFAMEKREDPVSFGGGEYYACRICGEDGYRHKQECPLAVCSTSDKLVYREMFEALSTTPSEAYERVQGLIEALKEVRKQCLDDHLCKFYGWFHVQEKVDNALQRYRGGESNV